jgi:hypothetical protein
MSTLTTTIPEVDEEGGAWGDEDDESDEDTSNKSAPPVTSSKRLTAPPPANLAKASLKQMSKKKSRKTITATTKSEPKPLPPPSSSNNEDAEKLKALKKEVEESNSAKMVVEEKVKELETDLHASTLIISTKDTRIAELEKQLEASKQVAQNVLSTTKQGNDATTSLVQTLEIQLDVSKKEILRITQELSKTKDAAAAAEAAAAANAVAAAAAAAAAAVAAAARNSIVVAASPSMTPRGGDNNMSALSDEISRLNFELSIAQKDKEKALALIVDLVGRKRLVRYLDAHGKDENALKTLKSMVRRGMSSSSKSPEKMTMTMQQQATVVPRTDHGAWWSTRDFNQVDTARGGRGGGGGGGGGEGGYDAGHRKQQRRSPAKRRQTAGRSGERRRDNYDALLQMASEQSTYERRAPFVSTGRRHSTFQGMSQSRNGHVPAGKAMLMRVEQEYEDAASGYYPDEQRW